MTPDRSHRPGRNLRPGPGGDQGARLDAALEIANGIRVRADRRRLLPHARATSTARQEFRVGNLYINRKITGALVDRQPFGGFKLSGIGSKAGGPDYLMQFIVPRTITENTLRRGFAPPENLRK